MRLFPILLFGLLLISGTSSAQLNLAGLSQGDASTGIKEALSKGLTTAVLNLNKSDGFFKTAYKVLLPPDAQKIETTLRKIGMGA